MADNDLKVIVKAKELAVHSFKLTSNSNRYPKKYRHSLVDRIQTKSLDIYDGKACGGRKIANGEIPSIVSCVEEPYFTWELLSVGKIYG